MKIIALLAIFITTFIQYVAVHADVGALREDRNLAGCDESCQNCKEFCQSLIPNCGNKDLTNWDKCNVGSCVSFICKDLFQTAPGDKNNCAYFCQFMVSRYCEPSGGPEYDCFNGKVYSQGDCFRDLNCQG